MLGAHLRDLRLVQPIVLGLPRGGVVVASEVSAALGGTFDVLVARKIGHPAQRELGVGAIAEGGEPTYDEKALARYGLKVDDLAPAAEAEQAELARRVASYRGGRSLPPMGGRNIVLVDDGIATGVTARAALQALRAQEPARLVFAVPVGPEGSADQLPDADDVVILRSPRPFVAVGKWYDDFAQVSDDEVLRLLAGD